MLTKNPILMKHHQVIPRIVAGQKQHISSPFNQKPTPKQNLHHPPDRITGLNRPRDHLEKISVIPRSVRAFHQDWPLSMTKNLLRSERLTNAR